jgi:D-beta-D-heptose 7-phosphate kinase/D-beta-D-heptose 1-phosphate adenosyltransferase
MSTKYKIKTQDEIVKIAEQLKKKGKTIVTTNGSFDILHSAHVNMLEQAKLKGDILILLLNSDSSIKRNKGNGRPIIREEGRARLLAGLECIDYIVVFSEDTPLKLLEKIKPQIHVKGGSVEQARISEEQTLLAKWKGKFIQLPFEPGFSTTNIIKRILEVYKK